MENGKVCFVGPKRGEAMAGLQNLKCQEVFATRGQPSSRILILTSSR